LLHRSIGGGRYALAHSATMRKARFRCVISNNNGDTSLRFVIW